MAESSDIDDSSTEDLLPFLNDIVRHSTLTIRVRGFSSCSERDIIELAEYDCDDDAFREHFVPAVWLDGSTSSEKDTYLWISFLWRRSNSTEFNLGSIEFRCVASVIDAFEKKRYSQTLSYVSDSDRAIKQGRAFALSFDKYIKRSSLLSNPSELLPDDTLTLRLDIDYENRCRYRSSARLEDFGCSGHCTNSEGDFCIRMDSAYGQNLCQLSSVLQNMMESGMAESATGLLPLPSEERYHFQLLHHINKEDDYIVSTIGGICRFYIFADKYDMQSIIQICRDLLMSAMLTINSTEVLNYVDGDIHEISELAGRFDRDESLTEILALHSHIRRKLEGGDSELEASSISEMETGWTCEYTRNNFHFSKIKKECIQMDCYK